MHAIQIRRFGGPEVLEQVELPYPGPANGRLARFGRLACFGAASRVPPPPVDPGDTAR
jgi:hypothetical protein